MKLSFDHCSQCDCGQKRPIINKKHYLCDQKNWQRLHPGQTRTYSGLQAKKQLVAKKPMNQISTKERQNRRNKTKAYKTVDQREPICQACLRPQGGDIQLSHSHIIPVSYRKDLESDPNNIQLECMTFGEHEGCHDIWERGTMMEKVRQVNFHQKMNYIKENDIELYNFLMQKLEDERSI